MPARSGIVALVIAVFGAGAIGCWVGGKLAASGAAVTLIGRPRMLEQLASGLVITDFAEPQLAAAGGLRSSPHLATTPSAAAKASLVLVTVKSAQTAEAASALAAVAPPTAVIVSLQNGIRNAEVLRKGLPQHRVLAAMVPFNVTWKDGRFHRASGGMLRIDDDPANAELLAACARANLAIEPRRDMPAVQWAKLVMNLNNAINALSGLPLARELAERGFRRCLAAAQTEALDVLAAARQPIARLTAIPPRWMPRLLATPDAVFSRLARRVVAIDPHARSSMWDDLEAGRPTEIDYLQGEVVALADKLDKKAPVNRRLVELVRTAEAGGKRDFTAPQLQRALGL